ncbi:hypothetical protein M5689_013570 [Euphorbia peplus]|nr:hypothetical protein M5689_013570 [Euphorbia peplus]
MHSLPIPQAMVFTRTKQATVDFVDLPNWTRYGDSKHHVTVCNCFIGHQSVNLLQNHYVNGSSFLFRLPSLILHVVASTREKFSKSIDPTIKRAFHPISHFNKKRN